MLKKILSIILALAMMLSLVTVEAFAFKSSLSKQSLSVNGESITCEKYTIDGYNYFKLRDIAQLLNGTKSQFEVGWDSATGTIAITTGAPYTTVGGELVVRGDLSSKTTKSTQTIMIDGQLVSNLSVYNIGNNNFFKLRDLGDALGFNVDYDSASNTAIIESTDTAAVKVKNIKEAYGLSKYATTIANPTTNEDYLNNMLIAIIEGNFEFCTDKDMGTYQWRAKGSGIPWSQYVNAHVDVLGFMLNQTRYEPFYRQGKLYIYTDSAQPLYTPKEISQQIYDAYNAAVTAYNNVHTDGLTQKQQAQKYIDYYYSNGIKTNTGGGQTNSSENMKYDTAYAALVKKETRCGGVAASMNLLLHMEGIQSFGVHTDKGNGHIISQMMLDGTEYLCDVHNKVGLFTAESSMSSQSLVQENLDYVRSLF